MYLAGVQMRSRNSSATATAAATASTTNGFLPSCSASESADDCVAWPGAGGVGSEGGPPSAAAAASCGAGAGSPPAAPPCSGSGAAARRRGAGGCIRCRNSGPGRGRGKRPLPLLLLPPEARGRHRCRSQAQRARLPAALGAVTGRSMTPARAAAGVSTAGLREGRVLGLMRAGRRAGGPGRLRAGQCCAISRGQRCRRGEQGRVVARGELTKTPSSTCSAVPQGLSMGSLHCLQRGGRPWALASGALTADSKHDLCSPPLCKRTRD